MKEISIEKVVIKIGKKTLELTVGETKALKTKLNELVGTTEYTPYVIPYEPYKPFIEPYSPTIFDGTTTSKPIVLY